MTGQYEGVLAVNKPVGWTSHDVVAKTRRILSERRIGHTGTLDPDVTGVLPLCIGRATRIVEYLQELPKIYEAELTIGYATDTEDSSGTVVDRVEQVSMDEQQLRATMQRFIGQIQQVPPMYSAVKLDGKRLYELARDGQEVEREARTVTIHDLQLLAFNNAVPWPTVQFRVNCSKGTYIRTLCVDIGKALGYPAVMSKLVRTQTSGVSLEHCYDLAEIEQMVKEGTLQQALIPVDQAIRHLPKITIEDKLAPKAQNGIAVPCSIAESGNLDTDSIVRVYDSRGFIGLFQFLHQQQIIKPVKVFRAGR